MKNPYIEPEDYFSPYVKSLEDLKKDPNHVEIDKLCWHVFNTNEDGKKLLNIFKDRIIYGAVPSQISDNYHFSCIYYEGYRQAFRQLIEWSSGYQKRMDYAAQNNSEDNQ